MGKNYLKHVSDATKLDIMQTVIKLYGHRTDIIVEMVEDGYPVTLELLELLYRIRSFDTLKKVLYYDYLLLDDNLYVDYRMALLKQAFGEKEALNLREEIIQFHKIKAENKAKDEEMKWEAELDNLYETYGLSEEFFKQVGRRGQLVRLALKRYDKAKVIKGLVTSSNNIAFLRQFISLDEMIEQSLYKQVLNVLWYECFEERFRLAKKIAQSDDGFAELIRLSRTSEPIQESLTRLAEDDDLKERFKKNGKNGYLFLFNAYNMSVEEFEYWCTIDPEVAVKHYRQFKKSIFWVIKKGYLKYLR